MDPITIEGLHEDAFRQSIEDQLRRGLADEAAQRLHALIEPYAGDHRVLPARFLHVSPADIEISGWEELDQGLKKFDRAEQPVTAICLSFGDPDGKAPTTDGAGLMTLIVETSYFSDEAFPFSESDRNDLLDGYSSFGCQWAGDCEGVDHAISFRGVDDLHGALGGLEQRLLSSREPDPDEIRAGTIASCYLSVLFHQALRDTAAKRRLGRPLCVLTANNGVYPSFDAPVLSCDEYLSGGEVHAVAAAQAPEPVADECFAPAHAVDDDEEGAEEASLLSIGIRRVAKQPALALAEEDDGMSMEAMASAALGGTVGLPPAPPPPAFEEHYPEPEQAYPALPEPAEEDVFEDPASFVEIEAEAETASPEPEAELSLTEEPEPVPVVSTNEESAVPPFEESEIEPATFENPPLHDEPAAWNREPADRPAPHAAYVQQMGDTEWPEREEEPEPAVELVEAPKATAPPKRIISPENQGHSLRARLTVTEIEPEASESWFGALLGRVLRLLRLKA